MAYTFWRLLVCFFKDTVQAVTIGHLLYAEGNEIGRYIAYSFVNCRMKEISQERCLLTTALLVEQFGDETS